MDAAFRSFEGVVQGISGFSYCLLCQCLAGIGLACPEEPDGAGDTVDEDFLSVFQPVHRVGGAGHCRQAILPGHHGAVR